MKKLYIVFIFVGFLMVLLAKSILTTKNIMQNRHHFVIEDIDTLSKGELVFYYDDRKVSFTSFWVTKFDSILIGDSVAKDSCDKYLKFYRFDEKGEAKLISKQESVMLIGRELFCD